MYRYSVHRKGLGPLADVIRADDVKVRGEGSIEPMYLEFINSQGDLICRIDMTSVEAIYKREYTE